VSFFTPTKNLGGTHMSFAQTMRDALSALDLEEEDYAARDLAIIYAEIIETAHAQSNKRTVLDFGPKLTTLLSELLMTPKARAALIKTSKEVDADEDYSAEAQEFAALRA
jgi:hypothetical protein